MADIESIRRISRVVGFLLVAGFMAAFLGLQRQLTVIKQKRAEMEESGPAAGGAGGPTGRVTRVLPDAVKPVPPTQLLKTLLGEGFKIVAEKDISGDGRPEVLAIRYAAADRSESLARLAVTTPTAMGNEVLAYADGVALYGRGFARKTVAESPGAGRLLICPETLSLEHLRFTPCLEDLTPQGGVVDLLWDWEHVSYKASFPKAK